MRELPPFELNDGIDVDALSARFAAEGRVRIASFLTPAVAQALHDHLRARQDWKQVINSGDKVFELDRAARAALTADQAAALDQAVRNGARTGFQFRYEAIRLPDGDATLPPVDDLSSLPDFLSSPPAIDLLRRIVDPSGGKVAFADGQATAFSPGDFLTAHDDEVAGKRRVAAYVLGLTPQWRADWGGALLFHGHGGAIEGRSPGFNTLDLFAVPQVHSVSLVSPAAAYRRYAVTGWLRERR